MRLKILVLTALLALLCQKPQASDRFELSDVAHLFPSAGLEDKIEFWRKAFTKYGARTVLIHDRDDVGLVYEKKTFDRSPQHSVAEYREQERWTDDGIKQIAGRLKALADDPTLARRSDDHQDLLEAFEEAGVAATRERLLRAADNVRSQRGIKEKFEAGLIRSALYLDYIREAFRDEGLPEELAYLPHVESSFEYSAHSKVGAAGIWQFMRSTARTYRLRVDSLVDQRLDPIAATHAAARLIRDNHAALGTWPLAVTAYNHGRGGMVRATAAHGNDYLNILRNYQSRVFGFASKNFYSEFLAALEVAKNYKHYFGPLSMPDPLQFDVLRLTRPQHVRSVISVEGLSAGVLQAYNPHLRPLVFQRGVIPAVELRFPKDKASAVGAALRHAPPAREPKTLAARKAGKAGASKSASRYKVRRGDNLASIATRFRTTINALRRLNRINGSKLYVGQMLILP